MKFRYHLCHKEISYIFAKTLENKNTKWDCTEQQLEMDDFQKYSRLSTVATARPKYSRVPNVSKKWIWSMTFYIPLDRDELVTSFKTFRRVRFADLNTFNNFRFWVTSKCCFEHLQYLKLRGTHVFLKQEKTISKIPPYAFPFPWEAKHQHKDISHNIKWIVMNCAHKTCCKSWTTTGEVRASWMLLLHSKMHRLVLKKSGISLNGSTWQPLKPLVVCWPGIFWESRGRVPRPVQEAILMLQWCEVGTSQDVIVWGWEQKHRSWPVTGFWRNVSLVSSVETA